MEGEYHYRKKVSELNSDIHVKSAELSRVTEQVEAQRRERDTLKTECDLLEYRRAATVTALADAETAYETKRAEHVSLSKAVSDKKFTLESFTGVMKTRAQELQIEIDNRTEKIKELPGMERQYLEASRKLKETIDAVDQAKKVHAELQANTAIESTQHKAELDKQNEEMKAISKRLVERRQTAMFYAKRINGYYREMQMKEPIPMDF